MCFQQAKWQAPLNSQRTHSGVGSFRKRGDWQYLPPVCQEWRNACCWHEDKLTSSLGWVCNFIHKMGLPSPAKAPSVTEAAIEACASRDGPDGSFSKGYSSWLLLIISLLNKEYKKFKKVKVCLAVDTL